MNKRKILVTINIVIVILMVIVLTNTSIISQVNPGYFTEGIINVDDLKKVIIDIKLLMYAIPMILVVDAFFLLAVNKNDILINTSAIITVFALLFIIFNLITFDNKILSDDQLLDNVELTVYKVQEDSYTSNSEYINELVDIIFY